MSQVFYRAPRHAYPMAVRAEGVYLYDKGGKQYLDGSGGAAVSCLGHGNRHVIEAIKSQLDQVAFAHTTFFTNEPQEELSARLSRRFGEENARVYFLSGGSEANETAVKLARSYWRATGRTDKHLIISRHQSYHGNTLATLSLSGNPGRRKNYAPMLIDWPKIAPCHAYRDQAPEETAEEYAARCARALETEIMRQGPENVAAFIAETVVGATLGCVAAAPGYLKRIRAICDKYQILLILDEVMAGSGRTGSYFAFEQEDVRPDIVTLAKGIGGGYLPLAATLCRGFIHDRIIESHGAFEHGHTYVGHATACAAGLAVMTVLDREKLLPNVRTMGEKLKNRLQDAFRDHPHVGDIRGRGLFIGLEFVADRDSKAPPDPALHLPQKIKQAAMDHGLICYPGGGTVDGVRGAHVLLAPPFIYQDRHIDELVDKLSRTIKEQKFT